MKKTKTDAKLAARQVAFDRLPSEVKRTMKRPGSRNRKKT